MANLSFWRGNTDFDRFRREMDRLFDGFFTNYSNTGYTTGTTTTTTGTQTSNWLPACDLVETDKTYVIKAELPGVTDKDIDVQVASNQLTIRGDKKADWDETKGAFHFTERTHGTFYRSFTLPNTVDATKIRARCTNGVLEVEMPKTTTSTLAKIKVEQK